MSKVKALYDGFVGTTSGPVLLHEGEEHDADSQLVRDRPDLFTEPEATPKRPILSRDKSKSADD